MNIASALRRLALPAASMLIVVACGSSANAGWTYAPLGPTPEATATAGPPSVAPGSPSGSGGAGTTIALETTQDEPLKFNPPDFTVPAGASVTVDYMNNSNLPHNVQFFDGSDSSAPSLGLTTVVTGPNAPESVTFTAPTTPGDYFFWCDVHQAAMEGIYHVQ